MMEVSVGVFGAFRRADVKFGTTLDCPKTEELTHCRVDLGSQPSHKVFTLHKAPELVCPWLVGELPSPKKLGINWAQNQARIPYLPLQHCRTR